MLSRPLPVILPFVFWLSSLLVKAVLSLPLPVQMRIQELLLTLQPGAGGGVADVQPDPSLGDGPNMDDALSLAASANLFNERVTEDGTLNTAGETSYSPRARCSSGRLGSA